MRRYRTVLLAVPAAVLSAMVILGYTGLQPSGGASAVELPTACDNFVAAANAFASHGLSGSTQRDPAVFTAHAADEQADTVRELLDACSSQIVGTTP